MKEGMSKFTEAVVYGAAAALGSAVVALAFNFFQQRSAAHQLIVPQTSIETDPNLVACLYPNSCSLSIRSVS
jgi:Na+-translocating ferredoxin:NAD+ oxidoreductase RnfA subunit